MSKPKATPAIEKTGTGDWVCLVCGSPNFRQVPICAACASGLRRSAALSHRVSTPARDQLCEVIDVVAGCGPGDEGFEPHEIPCPVAAYQKVNGMWFCKKHNDEYEQEGLF